VIRALLEHSGYALNFPGSADKPLRIPYTSGKRRHVQSRGVLWIGNIRCQYIDPLAKKEHALAESLNPCRRTRKRAKYTLGHACDWSTWRGVRNDVQFLRIQNHSYVFGQYTLLLHFYFVSFTLFPAPGGSHP
jgi:hypothetical protein